MLGIKTSAPITLLSLKETPQSIINPPGANVSLCKPCYWGAFVLTGNSVLTETECLTGSSVTAEGWNGPYQCYKFRQSVYTNNIYINYFLPSCRNAILTGQIIRNNEFFKSDILQSNIESYKWYKDIKSNCPEKGSEYTNTGCG